MTEERARELVKPYIQFMCRRQSLQDIRIEYMYAYDVITLLMEHGKDCRSEIIRELEALAIKCELGKCHDGCGDGTCHDVDADILRTRIAQLNEVK